MSSPIIFREGIFESLVKIQIESGLAVDFARRSFEQRGFPGSTKGTFNLWFRIPQATINAMIGLGPGDGIHTDGMTGIIPIVTWGQQQRAILYDHSIVNVAFAVDFSDPAFIGPGGAGYTPEIIYSGASSPAPVFLPPSFIGLQANDDGTAHLVINLQMTNRPTISGYAYSISSAAWYSGFSPPRTPGDPIETGLANSTTSFNGFYSSGFAIAQASGLSDTSMPTLTGQPELFIITPYRIPIIGDHWHNIQLSYDLSHPVNAQGFPLSAINDWTLSQYASTDCRIYLAVDDVNYTGDDLGPNCLGGSNGGSQPNAVVTNNAVTVALQNYNDNPADQHNAPNLMAGAPGIFTYQPAPFGGNIGFPATSDISGHISEIELAEFDYYPTVMNMGDVSNRRLFVDNAGFPVKPAVRDKLIGKPTLRLHKSSNWIRGINTGGNVGNFGTSGTITRYKPDPSLHGPQGK